MATSAAVEAVQRDGTPSSGQQPWPERGAPHRGGWALCQWVGCCAALLPRLPPQSGAQGQDRRDGTALASHFDRGRDKGYDAAAHDRFPHLPTQDAVAGTAEGLRGRAVSSESPSPPHSAVVAGRQLPTGAATRVCATRATDDGSRTQRRTHPHHGGCHPLPTHVPPASGHLSSAITTVRADRRALRCPLPLVTFSHRRWPTERCHATARPVSFVGRR